MLKQLIALFAEMFFDKRLNENRAWVPQQMVPDSTKKIEIPFPTDRNLKNYTPPQDGVFRFGVNSVNQGNNYIELNCQGVGFSMEENGNSYLSFTVPVYKGVTFSYKTYTVGETQGDFKRCTFIPYVSTSSS